MTNQCVKQETIKEIARDGRFIAYDDGTVLDTRTSLMWASKDNGQDIKASEAKFYCETFNLGGYNDWRLPSLDELEDLYDGNKDRPAKCVDGVSVHVATELIDISCSYLWSSNESSTTNETGNFNFNAGMRTAFATGWSKSGRVLPVRLFKWYSYYQ
jgi:hypothetical protein